MLHAAIFDVDETLVKTEYYQWKGWDEVLKKRYGISLGKEAYYKYCGKRRDIIEAELQEDYKLDFKEGELGAEKEKLLMHWFATEKLELMPFAREAIDFFRSKCVPVAAAGGAPMKEVMLKLQRVNIDGLFDFIVAGDEVKRGKPFPDIYLLAAEKLKVKPEECIAFEDTMYGLAAAKDAGAMCFAVPGEFSAKQDFSRADGAFKSLKEAVEEVKRRFDL